MENISTLMNDDTFDNRRVKTRYILITANIIFGILFIGSILPVMISPMMFDSPGSENYFTTWLLFLGVVTFPISCILSFIIPWILYKKKKYNAAVFWSFLPSMNILLVAGTWTYLSVFCSGFLCA